MCLENTFVLHILIIYGEIRYLIVCLEEVPGHWKEHWPDQRWAAKLIPSGKFVNNWDFIILEKI